VRLEVRLHQTYPHPPEKVWRALTHGDALAEWLMENDFEPEVGRECIFRFCDPAADGRERSVRVTVLELDPPRRMAWSWHNEGEAQPTRVLFELEPAADGTRLTLTHTGPVSDPLGRALTRGWPKKLAALRDSVGRPAD
jgi:uncharacterized protein YndB with AHSA1/START domain